MMVKAVHPYRYTKQMRYVDIAQGKGAICVWAVSRKFFEKRSGKKGRNLYLDR
jgi:hypothetical protein